MSTQYRTDDHPPRHESDAATRRLAAQVREDVARAAAARTAAARGGRAAAQPSRAKAARDAMVQRTARPPEKLRQDAAPPRRPVRSAAQARDAMIRRDR